MVNKNESNKLVKLVKVVAGTAVVTVATVTVFAAGALVGAGATLAYRLVVEQGKPFKGCPIDVNPANCRITACPLATACANYEKAKEEISDATEVTSEEEAAVSDEQSNPIENADEQRVNVPYEWNV